MESGVTIIDPSNTMISSEVEIGKDTVIFPGTFIQRRVTIGSNCEIGPHTYIYGPAEIGSGSTVVQSHISRSSIGKNCQVGPFAHIREGCDISDNVRLGSFVEVKNSAIGDNTSASHLTYLGDAKIKNNCNFGAGTVIANYDHRSGLKHECTIGSNVSTGANSVLVSPIEIGKDSMIAAGSVITKKVPENTLAIARPRQEHKTNRTFVRKN
jgi:bifunctional UDP-N-acetylglucosamine pyrophosphorylase/glucosamine-1-phosphate N-acetyltransferase